MCLIVISTSSYASEITQEDIEREVDKTKAVIHHTATPYEMDIGAEDIRRWHIHDNGWDDIGYHFVIRKDGRLERGRPLTKKGAHAKGRNHYVGIALVGYQTMSCAQKDTLLALLRALGTEQVEAHHENCPGKGLNIEGLNERLMEEDWL